MSKVLRFVIATGLILAGLIVPATGFAADKPSDLTPVGLRAFDDLTRCINTQHILDIYYLVDESNSLPLTDPEKSRADILASSLEALGNFGAEVKVNYAVGFFGERFNPWQSWRQVNGSTISSEAKSFAAEVRTRDKSNETNWKLGIEGAKNLILAQNAQTHGCSALIWLTDGGLWIHKKGSPANQIDQSAVDNAMGTLCDSTFQELRNAKVSVFGVLLKNDEILNRLRNKNPVYFGENDRTMQRMRVLVEGTGNLEGNGSSGQCGSDLQDSDAAGALLIAKDPVTLALQFMIMNGATQGGKESALPAGNPTFFEIEPGVRKIQLITTSKHWILSSAKGATYQDGTTEIPVEQTNGVQVITISGSRLTLGKWNFAFDKDHPVTNKLLLFSGLTIKLDPQQLMAGYKGVISGHLVVPNSKSPVDMTVYRVTKPEAIQVQAGNKTSAMPNGSLERDGSFSVPIIPTNASEKIEFRVTFKLYTINGTELAPVSISKFLDIHIPSNYPSFEPSIELSKLNGPEGKSEGLLHLTGPKNGSGSICIPASAPYGISIVNDAPDRNAPFNWKIKNINNDGCIQLAQNEKASIKVEVTNPNARDAKVLAQLPLKVSSAQESGKVLEYKVSINFETSIKRVGAIFIKFLLFALGIFFPLLLIYLVNRRTHKLIFGNGLQKAEYLVNVDSLKGITSRTSEVLKADAEDFVFIPHQDDVFEYVSPFGTAKAIVSPIPLAEPWAEITAPDGLRMITMVSGPARLKDRFRSGQISAMRQDMGKFWTLLIEESELQSATSDSVVKAKLIIFKRNRSKILTQHQDRLLEILATPGVWARVTEIKKAPKNAETIDSKHGKRDKKQKVNGSIPVKPTVNIPLPPSISRDASAGDSKLPPAPPIPPTGI